MFNTKIKNENLIKGLSKQLRKRSPFPRYQKQIYIDEHLDTIFCFFFEENADQMFFNYKTKKPFSFILQKKKKEYLDDKVKLERTVKNNLIIFTLTRLQLFNLISYIGHTKKKQRLNFLSYLYGIRNDLIILNQDFSLLLYKRSLRFFYEVLFFYARGFFSTNFVNQGFYGFAEYLLKLVNHAYFDGLYVGGVVSNYQNIQRIKKRYFFEYAFNIKVIRRILPSLIIISSTNNYYYAFRESVMSGIPSVGFIDSDLEFFDSFYPILGNNDNKATDFFLIISMICVIKNVGLKLRLKFILFKLKYLQFCFRFYIYLLYFKFNKIIEFYNNFRTIVKKHKKFFDVDRTSAYLYDNENEVYLKNIRLFAKKAIFFTKKKMKTQLYSSLKKYYILLKSFLSVNFNKIVKLKKFYKKKIKKKFLNLKSQYKIAQKKKIKKQIYTFRKEKKGRKINKGQYTFFKINQLQKLNINFKDYEIFRFKLLQKYIKKKFEIFVKKKKKFLYNNQKQNLTFFKYLKYFFGKYTTFDFYQLFFKILKKKKKKLNIYIRKFLVKKNTKTYLFWIYKLRLLYNFKALVFDLQQLIIQNEARSIKIKKVKKIFTKTYQKYQLLLIKLSSFNFISYSKIIQRYNFTMLDRILVKNKIIQNIFLRRFVKRLVMFFSISNNSNIFISRKNFINYFFKIYYKFYSLYKFKFIQNKLNLIKLNKNILKLNLYKVLNKNFFKKLKKLQNKLIYLNILEKKILKKILKKKYKVFNKLKKKITKNYKAKEINSKNFFFKKIKNKKYKFKNRKINMNFSRQRFFTTQILKKSNKIMSININNKQKVLKEKNLYVLKQKSLTRNFFIDYTKINIKTNLKKVNKFIHRNDILKFIFRRLTNFGGHINKYLGLFMKFQQFTVKIKPQIKQSYRIQFQSSFLITQLSFINYVTQESTYEYAYFPQELITQYKKPKKIGKFQQKKKNYYNLKKWEEKKSIAQFSVKFLKKFSLIFSKEKKKTKFLVFFWYIVLLVIFLFIVFISIIQKS